MLYTIVLFSDVLSINIVYIVFENIVLFFIKLYVELCITIGVPFALFVIVSVLFSIFELFIFCILISITFSVSVVNMFLLIVGFVFSISILILLVEFVFNLFESIPTEILPFTTILDV